VKTLAKLPFLIIFFTSMSLGFQAGTNYILPVKLDIPSLPAPPAPRQLSVLASGQRSILVVVVDKLQSEDPRLESAWLVLYIPDNPRVTLMPVFPTLSRDIASDEKILEGFAVQKTETAHFLDEDFLQHLREMEFWWSGYVLLDQEGLDQISLSLIAPGNPGKWMHKDQTPKSEDSAPISQLPSIWRDSTVTAADQARYYLDLCRQAAHHSPPQPARTYFEVADLIPEHLSLDFYPEQFRSEIQALKKHGASLSCEFPLFYSDSVANR
jgi:hypothetical protein